MAGRKKVDPLLKKKSRPVSLDDKEYASYVTHSYKNGKSFTGMVRKLFKEDMERDKKQKIIQIDIF